MLYVKKQLFVLNFIFESLFVPYIVPEDFSF